MRELKFRAWNEAEQMMYYFDLATAADMPVNLYEDIMQFTGLLDKNGKEIYEGDIVAQWHSAFPDAKANYKVYFEDGAFLVWRTDKDNGRAVSHREPSCVEVIGNIYENEELLK